MNKTRKHFNKQAILVSSIALIIAGCISPVPATKVHSYERQGDYVHRVDIVAAPNVDLSGFTSTREVTTTSGDKIKSKIGIEKAQSTNSPAVIDSAYKGANELLKTGLDGSAKIVEATAAGAAKGALGKP